MNAVDLRIQSEILAIGRGSEMKLSITEVRIS